MADLVNETPFSAYQEAFDGQEGHVLDKALIADQRYHLQSVLMKVDAMSMAHALEVRVPLLDRRIMDIAARLSLTLLVPPRGPGKFVLRRLAARLGAPREIVDGAKRGFNVPIAALMRGQLARLGDRVLDRDADILAPFLRPDEVRRLWRAHLPEQPQEKHRHQRHTGQGQPVAPAGLQPHACAAASRGIAAAGAASPDR